MIPHTRIEIYSSCLGKNHPGAVVAPGWFFLFGVAGLIARISVQSALDVYLLAQRSYFGVSLFKSTSEFRDHSDALCKLAVEG